MTRLTTKIFFIILTTIVLISCKKEERLHRIKYVIEFIQTPDFGYTNWLELTVTPVYQTEYNYGEHFPSLSPSFASASRRWEYDYWEMKDGDMVELGLWTAKDYYYKLYVYIDDVEVSYKKVFIDDEGQYDIVEETGLDDNLNDNNITFRYSE
jgi:hypothetical protein